MKIKASFIDRYDRDARREEERTQFLFLIRTLPIPIAEVTRFEQKVVNGFPNAHRRTHLLFVELVRSKTSVLQS